MKSYEFTSTSVIEEHYEDVWQFLISNPELFEKVSSLTIANISESRQRSESPRSIRNAQRAKQKD